MEYALTLDNTPETVPGGSSLLLIHPSTAETDRIDIEFLKPDDDPMLVVSTRTAAREVEQKLDHYGVDPSRALILDALSAERGYTRHQSEYVQYIPSPEDLGSIVEETRAFLETNEGHLRVSVDSITEMIYYTDRQRARTAVDQLLALVEEHDAVALFHLAGGVHDEAVVEEFRPLFDGVVELDEEGNISTVF